MYVKNTKKIAEKLVSFADSLEFYNKFSEDVTEQLSDTNSVTLDIETNNIDDIVRQYQEDHSKLNPKLKDFEKAKIAYLIHSAINDLSDLDAYPESFIEKVLDNGMIIPEDTFDNDEILKIYQELLKNDGAFGNLNLLEMIIQKNNLVNCDLPTLPRPFLYVPTFGFIQKQMYYPILVLEDEEIAYGLDPFDILSHRHYVERAHGNVLALGLNLGYFVGSASSLETVSKVTVVDHHHDLIESFKTLVLPKLEHKEKIEIIETNEIEYLKQVQDGDYDYIFNDLKPKFSDLKLYIQVKELVHGFKKSVIEHYFEEDFAFDLERYVINVIMKAQSESAGVYDNDMSSIEHLEVYEKIQKLLSKAKIKEPEDIGYYLNAKNIIKLVS